MGSLSVKGVVGQIKWAYYTAAAVNGYTVTRTGGEWSLRGVVVNADAFKLAQRPLIFVAPTDKGEWRWPILELDIAAGALTARLGPPVE